MAKSRYIRATMILACALVAAPWVNARAQEVPVVTGEHWTKSSEQVKKAYLVGLANAVQIELAYAGSNQASDAQSVMPRLARGMKGQTLDGVRDALDAWYAKNPDRIQRPVVEIIWFEMVVPGLKKNS